LPALGGDPRQLTDFGSGPKWSHDGKMIAFQSDANPDMGSGSVGSSTIWVIPVQGGTPRQITKVGNPAGGHVSAAWYADDQRIIFMALNFSSQVFWSILLDGSDLKQITLPEVGKVSYPVFSSDGRGLFFTAGAVVFWQPMSVETGLPIGSPVQLTDVGA